MTELRFTDPCLLFALRREAAPFLRQFRPQQRFPGAPGRARFCGPASLSVLVVETGVGSRRSAATLDWLLAQPLLDNVVYRPRFVLAVGFSGGLQDKLKVGDVVLATEVIDDHGTLVPTTWPRELPEVEGTSTLHRGRILSMNAFIAASEQKRALGQRHNALAVDMESATVAQRCHQAGIPFGCIRAISDDLGTSLSPQLVEVLSGGRVSVPGLLRHLIASPRLVLECYRLAWQTRHAADRLASALGKLLAMSQSIE
jgi:adenosylhomocysteine nucleosidase